MNLKSHRSFFIIAYYITFSISLPCFAQPPIIVPLDKKIVPYREIGDTLGPRGRNYNLSNLNTGVVIFDANNDGRLDIYLPQNGRPVARSTPNGILIAERIKPNPSTLFLNQGNDANNDPIFMSVQDLSDIGNNTRVASELLIENKFNPRKSIKEDELRQGRIGVGALAADFNGDGRLDLYVLNYHYGIPFQTKELAMKIYPSKNNIGRGPFKLHKFLFIQTPMFMREKDLDDGIEITLNIDGVSESEGRNCLYLNLGDTDRDGIPEWKDITDQAGVGGTWASTTATVADIDRDGDLDLYVANFVDPDYVGFGSKHFPGNQNQLYLNQLSETGELRFVNAERTMKVSGRHEEEALVSTTYYSESNQFEYNSAMIIDGKQKGEKADHSWSAFLTDWNEDGYPDLMVANDIGNRLRVYTNEKGKSFKRDTTFDDPIWDSCWMGMQSGDLDGDMHDEIFIASCGSQGITIQNTAILNNKGDINNVPLAVSSVHNYLLDITTLQHALLSYNPGKGLHDVTLNSIVKWTIIPPDITHKGNIYPDFYKFHDKKRFATSLAGVEFSWGPALFDVDNDGDLDLYLVGSLGRGSDNIFGESMASPGRMLVNKSTPGNFIFEDRTLEYRLLDISHMDYDHKPPRRPAPGTGWHKRDYIYLTDRDSYSNVGLDASKTSYIRDIFRMHEHATAVMPGDLNHDGFQDIVVIHNGGYNSLSPKAQNLKAVINGKPMALPSSHRLGSPPTQLEPGKTFVYIHGGPQQNSQTNWIKIRLSDKRSNNVYGVGARITVNDKIVRTITIGGASFSAYAGDLHIGLGNQKLETVKIVWPSGTMEPQYIKLEKPVTDKLVCVDRQNGIVSCENKN